MKNENLKLKNMTPSFDEEIFLKRTRDVILKSRGKTFAQLAKEIETIRETYKGLRGPGRQFVNRHLSRQLLIFALDTSQPRAMIDRLYKNNVRAGFIDPAVELASALEYAYYCGEHGRPKIGLRVLSRVKKTMKSSREIPPEFLANFLEPIDKCERRLTREEKCQQKGKSN